MIEIPVFKLLLAVLAIYAVFEWARFRAERRKLTSAISRLPGPPEPRWPIIANTINILQYEFVINGQFPSYVLLYHEMLSNCLIFVKEGIHRFWMSWIPVVVVSAPETIEPVLTSNTNLTKADLYAVIEPWVGQGLLTSRGDKWRARRKIITPAFHFRILNDFLPIMNQSATTLIRKFNHIKYKSSFDINPPISLCTLDTISNTAMGIDLGCQADENNDYVKAIDEIQRLAFLRVARAWLWPDWIFYRTSHGKKFIEVRNLLHNFTNRVILERKSEWEQMLKSHNNQPAIGKGIQSADKRDLSLEDILDSKSFKESSMRLAFMDLLLYQHLVEKKLTTDDINEEVSTFMFEGHDTTASNIVWALYHLGLHPKIQDKVRAELDSIFSELDEEQEFEPDETKICGKLITTDVTMDQISKMKYLEMVLKETFRLTPTAPFMARNVDEDIKVDKQSTGEKYIIPAGSVCMIFAHALHMNPLVFENPGKFDPERFSPENTLKRHPFAHIPFSAGPRNCIGQRFALMEAKVILSKIIRNYFIESTRPFDKIRVVAEMILKSDDGRLNIRLAPRFV